MGLLGGAGEQLNFLIDLNADSAIREAKRFGDTVEKETGKAEGGLNKFSGSAAKFGVGAVAFGGAVLAGLGKAVNAYAEAETQHLKLTTAVANSDTVWSDQGKAVADAAQHLQTYTAVEGDAAEAGAAMLVQFGLTEDQIITLLPLVGDLSRRFGVDMETAAKAVGKAAAGEGATGLKKMGIVLDEAKYSGDAFGTTIDGLKGTVGGFAANEATTAAGKIEMLKNNLGDIVEGVGAGAADVLGAVVGPLADIAQKGGAAGDVLENVGKAGAIIGAGSALIGGLSLAASTVAKLKDNLTNAEGGLNRVGKAAAGIAIGGAVLAVGQLAKALDDATTNARAFDTASKQFDVAKSTGDKIRALDQQAEALTSTVDNVVGFFKGMDEVDLNGTTVQVEGLMHAIEQTPDSAAALDKVNTALKALGDADDIQSTALRDWLKDQRTELEKNVKATGDKEKADKAVVASTDDAAESTQEWTDKLKATNGALGLYELGAADAAAATKGFADAAEALDTDEMVTSSLALGDALKGVQGSAKDLPKTFDDNAAALGLYTDEQTKAVKSVTDWGDAAKAQITQLIASGAASDVVKAKAGAYRDSLTQVMRQAGLTDDQIHKYLDTLGMTPEDIETEVKLSGDAEARYRLGLLQSQIETLPKNVQTQVTQKILVGDYQGALATVNSYYANNPAKLPVNVVVNNARQALAEIKLAGGGAGPGGLAAPTGNAAATTTAAPVVFPTSTVTINMPAGTTPANTLASIRRYQRLGGDMGGLLDTVAAVR